MHQNGLKKHISVHGYFGPYARYVNGFQTSRGLGSATYIEKLGFIFMYKSKTCHNFMKLGMVSWHGSYAPWWKNVRYGTSFATSPLQTWASYGKLLWFWYGTHHIMWANPHLLHLLVLNYIFLEATYTKMSVVPKIWKIYIIRLAFLYINWLLYALFNVHNSNLNYNHKVWCIKMGWK